MVENNKKFNGSEDILYEKSNKYEPCNISEIRELAGLRQVDLARLTGLTQAYISEVEHGKKPLTRDSAEKIASVLNKLINEPGKSDYRIDPVLLWAGHWTDQIARNHTQDIQYRMIDLFLEISQKKAELDYIIKHQHLPADSYVKEHFRTDTTQIASLVKKRSAVIEANKEAMNKKEESDDMSSSVMGFVPRF